MDNSPEADTKARALGRMAARISEESKTLPYRWGYFQGVALIPWSLLSILGTVAELVNPPHELWYVTAIALLMGILGLPLAFGLLRKKAFALPLVYVMFGLSLFLMAVKLPMAIRHYGDFGYRGSAIFEAELLLVWLLSLLYYRRRRVQFH